MGILYELASGLFGTIDNPFPAFEMMNRGLLESAISLPHQPYYETFHAKLAAMVRSIAANHSLRDGNKRLAVTVLHSTLLVNDYLYMWDDETASELVLRCANGDTDFRWLADFLEMWSAQARTATPLPLDDPQAIRTLLLGMRSAVAEKITDSDDPKMQQMHLIALANAKGMLPAETIAVLLAARRASPDLPGGNGPTT